MQHLLLCVKLNPPFLGSGDLEEWQERVQLFLSSHWTLLQLIFLI